MARRNDLGGHWTQKNCANCNLVFCGLQQDFCSKECELSFSLRERPEDVQDMFDTTPKKRTAVVPTRHARWSPFRDSLSAKPAPEGRRSSISKLGVPRSQHQQQKPRHRPFLPRMDTLKNIA
mmetsp:Transcript_16549/g.42062  ORF Transcript_16549/g.42062 Transcript_16549/m.42062 type:complete len:122 (+) Transcript_16549:195-560(+)